MDDAGTVTNVSSALGPRKGGKPCVGPCPLVEQEDVRFSVRMDQIPSGPRPRLLIAVASAEPMKTIAPGISEGADKLFEKLLTEATSRSQTLGAAAKYVNVTQ